LLSAACEKNPDDARHPPATARLEIPVEAAVDHRPRIQVAARAAAAGADVEEHVATPLVPALQ